MKPYTLTDREGEHISPLTSTRTVFDDEGVDLATRLAQLEKRLAALEGKRVILLEDMINDNI